MSNNAKTVNCRKIYLTYLIENGVDNLADLLEQTPIPKRTLQKDLASLSDLDIVIEAYGGTKNRAYTVNHWGMINKAYVYQNISSIKAIALNENS